MIQLLELIVTDLTTKGNGKELSSPVRKILEIYSKDGILMAFNDSQGNYSIEDLISFGKFCILKKDLPIDEIFQQWKF